MSDLIDRKAAIEAFQMFRKYDSNRSNSEWVDRIETVLNNQSTFEDVFSVVKCKDCTFRSSDKSSISGMRCNLRGDFIFSNDYCSYAVRRKE